MQLPDKTQSRAGISPLSARVLLAGTPKVGKSTLAASWMPENTLIVDTQKGTTLLDGEHYVQHVRTWPEFTATIDLLVADPKDFKTVVIDMVDDVWNMADEHFAGRGKPLASATDDYSKAIKTAEGMFRQTVGKLLATDLGVWFISHTREHDENGTTRHKAKLDGRVLTYVQGACEFVFLAERFGPKRVIHTSPSEKFEAGSRVALPEPMDLDARKLYAAMAAGLEALAVNGNKKTERVVV